MAKKKVSKGSPVFPISPAAYAAGGGIRCPFCGSRNIRGEHIEVEGGKAYQEVGCDDCDKSWLDEYKLVGWIPKG